MRVQPHLPSSPFTATVIERAGLALCAWSAANSPAPPDPRIRTSVSTDFTLLEPLYEYDNYYQCEPDDVEQGLRIDEQEPGDDEHRALGEAGALEEPSLQAARQGDDAYGSGDRDQRDRAPVGAGERLERAGEQQPGAAGVEHEHEGHEERGGGVFPALQRGLVRVAARDRRCGEGRERGGRRDLGQHRVVEDEHVRGEVRHAELDQRRRGEDRKSTRLNSSHSSISYAVFCLKKKKKRNKQQQLKTKTKKIKKKK